jgi:fructose 1,6-bisphosphatase
VEKTDPGAYTLPLYLAFTDSMHTSGASMLPYSELEYGGIVDKINVLDKRFTLKR